MFLANIVAPGIHIVRKDDTCVQATRGNCCLSHRRTGLLFRKPKRNLESVTQIMEHFNACGAILILSVAAEGIPQPTTPS